MKPIEWEDQYFISDTRKLYTGNEMRVGGVRAFGHLNTMRATLALPDHIHRNCFEIHYLCKGYCTFEVGGCDYLVRGGDIFVTFPDEVHSTGNKPLTGTDLYWVQLDIRDLSNILGLGKEAATLLIGELGHIPKRQIATNGQPGTLIRDAFHLLISDNNLNKMHGSCALTMFLHKLIESSYNPISQYSKDMYEVLDYVVDNIYDEIPLERLAQIANLSLSRFKQKFKEQVGITPKEFVNYSKIERSKTLLLENSSITEIAHSLSFSTSNYFASVFKRFTTHTPSEYTRLAKEKKIAPPSQVNNVEQYLMALIKYLK